MKKTLGIIVALGLVVGLILLLLPSSKSATSSKATTANIAQYLPPDTLFVCTASNIKAMITEIPKSPLGRLLGQGTVHAMMQEMQASPQDIAGYDEVHKSITDFLDNQSFSLLFGDTFTFAILPINLDQVIQDEKTASGADSNFLSKYFIAITTTTSPAVLHAFSTLNANIKVTEEQIDGLSMLKIALPEEIAEIYAYIDGRNVLMSMDPAGITTCLANKASGQPLTKDPGFAKVEQLWFSQPDERSYFRFSLNMRRMVAMLDEARDPEIVETLSDKNFKQMVNIYQGLDYLFGLTYTTPNSLENQYSMSYEPEKLHPDMKRLLSQQGEKNTYLFLLNHNPLLYVWATPLDLIHMVNVFANDPYTLKTINEELEGLVGLTLDELARTLGPQNGFTLDSIVTSGLFPIPKMTFWVEVRDKNLAEKAIAAVIEKTREYGPAVVQEKVNEVPFYSWPLLPGDAGQPAVAVHNNTLYLTTSTNSMRAILNNKAVPTQMPAATMTKLGAEMGQKIANANSSAALMYPDQFAMPLLGLIDFANHYYARGAVPTLTLKKELGFFLNSMDYMAGYCDAGTDRVDCRSVLQWKDKEKVQQ